MVPVLFFVPGSCAFGSMVALEWLGEPYRLSRIGKEDHDSAAYRALSPLGEVPALLTGAGVITESVAILHHIGARDSAHGLVPEPGTPAFDRFNMALAYLTTTLHPGFQPIFHADRIAPDAGSAKIVYDTGVARLPARYDRVEAMIGEDGWLVGNGPTLADAYLFGIARWGDSLIDMSPYPRLAELRARLADDPAVRFALAAEADEAAATAGGFQGFVPLERLTSARAA